jgi:hypothetical protein
VWKRVGTGAGRAPPPPWKYHHPTRESVQRVLVCGFVKGSHTDLYILQVEVYGWGEEWILWVEPDGRCPVLNWPTKNIQHMNKSRHIIFRVRPRFRFLSENWNRSEMSLRLEAKKGMISLVSHRSETAKIWSENERERSKMKQKKIERNENELKNCFTKKIFESEIEREISNMKRQNWCETKKKRKIV